MRSIHAGLSALVVLSVLFGGTAGGGEANDVYALDYGMRYCAAPWCDNKEFIDTHFGIDADTGKVTKYVGGDQPYQVDVTNDAAEVVLYSSAPPAAGYRPAAPARAPVMPPPVQPRARPVQPLPGNATAPRSAQVRQNPSGASRSRANATAPRIQTSRQRPESRDTVAHAGKRPWWKALVR